MNIRARLVPATLVIIFLSLVGMVAIYYGTTWGPWAFSDSTGYIVSARSFLAGHGFSYPAPSGDYVYLTLHPPFYPLLLSGLSLLGLSLIEAARWLNILLFGATILLSGIFTYYLYHSAWISVSLCLVILTLPAMVDVSSGAMTEPLFLFTITLGFCLLFSYLNKKRKIYLLLAAISISLACLTRYPGLIAILACIVVLFLAEKSSWKQRVIDSAQFSLVAVIPTGIWLLWVFHQTGSIGSRQYFSPSNLQASTIELRKKLMELFWSWLPFQGNLPAYSYNLGRYILIVASLAILALFSLSFFKKFIRTKTADRSSHEFYFPLVWFIFLIGYIAFIAVSFLFSSPVPDINLRTLLPVQFSLAFVVLPLLSSLSNDFHLPLPLGWSVAVLIVLLCLPNAKQSQESLNLYHEYGAGYTSVHWLRSLTLKMLSRLPLNTPLISNEPAALLLLTDRPAYELCSLPCNLSDSQAYGDDHSDPAQKEFRENGAALVYFYPYCGVLDEPWYAKTKAQIESLTHGLARFFSSCDGAIYFLPSSTQH